MNQVIDTHPVLVATVIIITVVGILAIIIAAALLGRSLKVELMGVKAELKPNGGSSLRDAVDRVEKAANGAVIRAEMAAANAVVAADKATVALHRIETQYPQTVQVQITQEPK